MARADAAEKEVLPAAQVAADSTRDAYETGALDLSAVLIAERALPTQSWARSSPSRSGAVRWRASSTR
jgi:hypothetical protein